MADFLKFAYELISKIVYNLVECVWGFIGGFIKLFITGWLEYIAIFQTYYPTLRLIPKIFAVLLVILLIALPLAIIYLVGKRIKTNIELRVNEEDNVVLYKEIGRLNKQVMSLMDEKDKILAMKVSGGTGVSFAGGQIDEYGNVVAGSPLAAGVPVAGVPLTAAMGGPIDPLADPSMMPMGGYGAPAFAVEGGSSSIGEDALASAAAAAATAAAAAKSQAEENERNVVVRFPKLSLVDAKYEDFEYPEYDYDTSLEQLVENYRLFAASQMHLYYTPEIVRRFVAGMASSKILILEGISGTGKTSLPYSFSRFLDNPATLISVQPSFRDRTELLGYFNEFSKRFNETEFLRALYEAGYREDPNFIVLDEMNLARIEYYFAEMLSVLELPNKDEWVLDLVPTAWPGDPVHMESGKVHVYPNTWFVGTANSDDSTFTITDKVYDRAMLIELNERADPFECELQPRCCITAERLQELFAIAKQQYPISEATMTKLAKMDQYLQTRFKLAFGNRIMKQMYDFIPVYVACGGTELNGLDYIIARKVLKKFESMNVSLVRDEIKGLIEYIEKTFGKAAMPDSRSYLERIQNLY